METDLKILWHVTWFRCYSKLGFYFDGGGSSETVDKRLCNNMNSQIKYSLDVNVSSFSTAHDAVWTPTRTDPFLLIFFMLNAVLFFSPPHQGEFWFPLGLLASAHWGKATGPCLPLTSI